MSTPATKLALGGPEGACNILSPYGLKNTYYAIRHGHAVNILEGILSSSPEVGTKIHPLTERGREQASASAAALCGVLEDSVVKRGKPFRNLVAYTSDFTRARETAEICLRELASRPAVGLDTCTCFSGIMGFPRIEAAIKTELRERWFGTLDNTTATNYNMIWPEDMKNARSDAGYGCESVEKVVARLKSLLGALEKEHEDMAIVLFSHADTIKILQTWMSGADVRAFSQKSFKSGEARELVTNDMRSSASSKLLGATAKSTKHTPSMTNAAMTNAATKKAEQDAADKSSPSGYRTLQVISHRQCAATSAKSGVLPTGRHLKVTLFGGQGEEVYAREFNSDLLGIKSVSDDLEAPNPHDRNAPRYAIYLLYKCKRTNSDSPLCATPCTEALRGREEAVPLRYTQALRGCEGAAPLLHYAGLLDQQPTQAIP
jgi:broad specificity phosphatase PhoE